VSLFGKNLTDEDYILHFLDVAAGYSASSATNSSPVYTPGLWSFGTVNRPRHFGVELEFKF
jgi:outer membrane receptor protein involved in Fe transport